MFVWRHHVQGSRRAHLQRDMPLRELQVSVMEEENVA